MSEEEKKTRLYEDLFDLLEQEFGQVRRSAIAIRVGDKFDWNGHVFESEELFHQAVADADFEGPDPAVMVIRSYRNPSAPPLPKQKVDTMHPLLCKCGRWSRASQRAR